MPPQLLEFLLRQSHFDLFSLLSLNLQDDFRSQNLREVVGRKHHIHFPLATSVVHRLITQILSWVLVFDDLGTLCNNWFVVCQKSHFLEVLAVKQINFALQTSENLERNVLQSIEIRNLLAWIGSQKLVDGTEWHSDIEGKLLKWYRLGV